MAGKTWHVMVGGQLLELSFSPTTMAATTNNHPSWNFLLSAARRYDPDALRVLLELDERIHPSPLYMRHDLSERDRIQALLARFHDRGMDGRLQWRELSWQMESPPHHQETAQDTTSLLDELTGPAKNDPPTSTETYRFLVKVVDEVGEAIANVKLRFSSGNSTQYVNTNGQGKASISGMPTSVGTVQFANEGDVRNTLRERWSQARGKPWFQSDNPHTSYWPVRRRKELESQVLLDNVEHTLVLQPWVVQARLLGMHFDTSKCFLLPEAMDSMRMITGLYKENPESDLLVVGHTDEAGEPSYNDPLSVERAQATAAYLSNDVESWYAWYSPSKSYEKRWGDHEDRLMIQECARQRQEQIPANQTPVRWYQSTRGLTVDGDAGPQTRHALIKEYMDIDGTTLPSDIRMETHGCGENFPAPPESSGMASAAMLIDSQESERRVEMFFFDNPIRPGSRPPAILPPPPGQNSPPGSKQYPEWLLRSRETRDSWARPPSQVAITYAVRFIDEMEHPIANLPVEFTLQGGKHSLSTDEQGFAQVTDNQAGTVSIQVASKDKFTTTVYERDPKLQRLSPLPKATPTLFVVSPKQALEGMKLIPNKTTDIMVVLRTHFSHACFEQGWKLDLESAGPWRFSTSEDNNPTHLSLLSRLCGARFRIVHEKKKLWWEASHDDLHDALFHARWSEVWKLLDQIPKTEDPPRPEPTDLPFETDEEILDDEEEFETP
jgi:outer membrane protein OmpA-like peptidoglycan-associated protein